MKSLTSGFWNAQNIINFEFTSLFGDDPELIKFISADKINIDTRSPKLEGQLLASTRNII